MFIDNMQIGSKVTIKVYSKKGTLSFDTEILGVYHYDKLKSVHCVAVTPIKVKGKLLSFKGHAVDAVVENSNDNRKYNFSIIKIGLTKKGDKLFLFSKMNVKPKNFRSAYRIPCSYKTIFRAGDSGQIDAHIHDISFSGISFVCPAKEAQKIEAGDSVLATVYDNNGLAYKIHGRVVRIAEGFGRKDNSLLGVVFDILTADLSSIIVKLQREECKKLKKL